MKCLNNFKGGLYKTRISMQSIEIIVLKTLRPGLEKRGWRLQKAVVHVQAIIKKRAYIPTVGDIMNGHPVVGKTSEAFGHKKNDNKSFSEACPLQPFNVSKHKGQKGYVKNGQNILYQYTHRLVLFIFLQWWLSYTFDRYRLVD